MRKNTPCPNSTASVSGARRGAPRVHELLLCRAYRCRHVRCTDIHVYRFGKRARCARGPGSREAGVTWIERSKCRIFRSSEPTRSCVHMLQSDLAYTPHLHIATYLGQKTRCFIHIDYGYLIRMKQPIVNLSIPLPDSYLQTMISPNTRATRVNMFAEFLHMLSPKTRSTPRNII